MSWEFSDDAKAVRRVVYGQFLGAGRSAGASDLLRETGLEPTEFTAAIEELERGLMVMCPPGSHDIAKCPPWSNVPTRHIVEVEGVRVAYAGCALEAMNVAYCYPGEIVTVRSSCPQTGEELIIRLRGNEAVEVSPATMVGHIGVDPALWSQNWFHACANNSFFVDENAVTAWQEHHPDVAGVTVTLEQLCGFAKYDYRLDYERGADPRVPDSGSSFLKAIGLDVVVPAGWS